MGGNPRALPAWMKVKVGRARRLLAPQRWVAAAYLYGSSLRTHRFEDVDLALLPLPRAKLPGSGAMTALALSLDKAFSAETDLHLVCDLVDPLRFRIVREGRRFFTRDGLSAVRFESETLIRFLDFKPSFDRLTERILRRSPW